MMKEIGGYFELEAKQGIHYHKKAIRLNTARNCLEYILRAKGYKKMYIPFYNCDVMITPIKRLNIDFQFYHINEKLEPLIDFNLKEDEVFLYINYFGINEKIVKKLPEKFDNVIIDNSQAFFSYPFKNMDTFYSARKFFGVPDGAYLYTNRILKEDIEKDVSHNRMNHLLLRADLDAQSGYEKFKNNELVLGEEPLKKMSKLTEHILGSIDYVTAKATRNNNFNFLHKKLCKKNKLEIDAETINGPMAYPFYCEEPSIRQKLIENNVFVATYWPNVIEWCAEGDVEYKLAKNLIPLPIDQRYNIEDMMNILEVINDA